MPPKKKEVEKPSPLLGRFGTSLKCGIVGLPNVGKSTFFNVLTKSAASAENFPFCTIGRVAVPDQRYDYLVENFKPVSKVPAYLHVTDIAGLVKGAHEGQGLGNAFLSHIRACDAIFHVVRAFDDENVTHVEGDINPVRDLQIVHDELRLKDQEYLMTKIAAMEKTVVRGNDKKGRPEYEILLRIKECMVNNEKDVRFESWNSAEIEMLNKHLLLTAKPVIYLVNLSEKDYFRKKNKWLAKIMQWVSAREPNATIIPFSGEVETKLLEMEPSQEEEYLKGNSAQSALAKIISTGFHALNLEYFFTVGKDEVRAWTIMKGTKAPQAAGKVHTDFEKGFIMAEVMKYEDFRELESEAAVKAAGKYRQQGRNYIVEDGDIIYFKFNAGAGLTGKKK